RSRRISGKSADRLPAACRPRRTAGRGARGPGRGGRWRAWRRARGGAGAGILALRDTGPCEPLVIAPTAPNGAFTAFSPSAYERFTSAHLPPARLPPPLARGVRCPWLISL